MNKFYVLLISKSQSQYFERNLPDESCRLCGGTLIDYIKCSECNKTTTMICNSCNTQTIEQFHNLCVENKNLSNNLAPNKHADYFLLAMA